MADDTPKKITVPLTEQGLSEALNKISGLVVSGELPSNTEGPESGLSLSDIQNFVAASGYKAELTLTRVYKGSAGERQRASERAEFIEFAKANQWKTRRERGFEWRTDVFDFVQEVYGEWIEKMSKTNTPLTQADIKAVDLSLWARFQQASSKQGIPDWLALPIERRRLDEGVTDPNRLKEIEIVRKVIRESTRRYRANKLS